MITMITITAAALASQLWAWAARDCYVEYADGSQQRARLSAVSL